MSPQKQLIQALHERGDQVQQQFYSLISDFGNEILTPQSAHSYILEILQYDRRSLELFNKNLPPNYNIRVLSDDKLREFLNYIIENLKAKGLDPNLLEDLTSLFHMFMESLSIRCFYSYEHLTESFLEKLFEYEIEKNVLSDELISLIESAIQAYKDSRPPLEEPVIEEPKIEIKEPKAPTPKSQTPSEAPKSKKASIPAPPVKEKFSCLDEIKEEHDIIEFLERKLPAEDFSSVVKIIFLYYKNVISYVELIEASSDVLGKLEKDALAMLRQSLESRETSRHNLNPFIPRIAPLKTEGINQSYKEILLNHNDTESSIINKRLVCFARGAEGGTSDSGGRRHFKNQYEEDLLKLEDELHEFDIMIQQFEFFSLNLKRVLSGKVTEAKKQDYIKKLLNTKVIFAIYGNKASSLIGSIVKGDNKVLGLIVDRLGDQIEKLQKAKSEFRDYWRSSMEEVYYRALDVLSNTLKLEEKKRFVNKEMMDELKEPKNKHGKYKLYDSIKIITPEPDNKLVSLESKSKRFFKPSFVLKLGNKRVMEDAVLILRLWLSCSKFNLTEKERANSIISKIIVQFMGVQEKPGKVLADMMNEETDLIAEILEITKKIEPKSDFKYFNEYDPLINEQKLSELYTLLTSLEPYQPPELTTEEPPYVPNSMSIKSENFKPAEDVFFASPMFYLFYRYFFCALDRLDLVYNYSQTAVKSDEIYIIFVKLLVLNLQGSLANQDYEDSLKLILRDKSGFFMNFDKFCQNAIKLNLNDEFSNFVLENNPKCFGVPNTKPCREDILFAKTCYKLNEMMRTSFKTKSQQNNSTIYGIPANEVLKFELFKDYLIVHRFKNIYQEESKFADDYPSLIDVYKNYLQKPEKPTHLEGPKGISQSKIVLHINHKRKEPVFTQCNEEDLVVGACPQNYNSKEKSESKINEFKTLRALLFERGVNK